MKLLIQTILCLIVNFSFSQVYTDTTVDAGFKRIQLNQRKGFSIGSYGEAHLNLPIEKMVMKNGTADLHRMILYVGYRFNSKLQFFSEIEVEHISQISIEQAFINYKINSAINFKSGVILIPMGYVNEFHEPTLFNGVERPAVDKYVIPTTWRELGIGFHGLVKKASLKYQVFMVNGFAGYDNKAKFSGKSGIRGGRQKASNAMVRTPSAIGKITFFGLKGLRLSLSGYYGKSESNLYNGIDPTNDSIVSSADSTSVGVSMGAINFDYTISNFKIRAEGILTSLSNTNQYNRFTNADLAQQIMGYYGEVSYVHQLKNKVKIIPFIRYENYDTHFKVDANIAKNKSFNREVLTVGLGYQLTAGTIFKSDYQWIKTAANPRPTGMFNLGFGFWF